MKEINQLSRIYHLGQKIRLKRLPGGFVNNNYTLITNKGRFIIRVLGNYDLKLKDLEIKVLTYLHNKKFQYRVPNLVKNVKDEHVSSLNNKFFEVYEKLPGSKIKILNNEQLRELAKSLALYHKCIKNIYLRHKKIDNFKWMLKGFVKMKKIKPKTELDKLMLNHAARLEKLTQNISKLSFKEDIVLSHSDFSKANVLFDNNKVVSILDFENVAWNPKVIDFKSAVEANAKKMKIFVKEYCKHNYLSDREIEMIVPFMILDCCMDFRWAYQDLIKRCDKKYIIMRDAVKRLSKLANLDGAQLIM